MEDEQREKKRIDMKKNFFFSEVYRAFQIMSLAKLLEVNIRNVKITSGVNLLVLLAEGAALGQLGLACEQRYSSATKPSKFAKLLEERIWQKQNAQVEKQKTTGTCCSDDSYRQSAGTSRSSSRRRRQRWWRGRTGWC
jgi:hypothetical protein